MSCRQTRLGVLLALVLRRVGVVTGRDHVLHQSSRSRTAFDGLACSHRLGAHAKAAFRGHPRLTLRGCTDASVDARPSGPCNAPRSEALGATEIHPSGAPDCAVLESRRRQDDRQSRTDIALVQHVGQDRAELLIATPTYRQCPSIYSRTARMLPSEVARASLRGAQWRF